MTPDVTPFTSWFAPSTLEFRPAEREALAAEIGADVRGENDWSADDPREDYGAGPHYGCPRDEIIPVTTDRHAVEQALANLQPWTGGGTMTHLGVVWGRRVLAPRWRSAWGLPEDDPDLERQRVLVLLTDGLNAAYDNPTTYPGRYQHNGTSYRTEFTSQYTGYGRRGSGTLEEGYRVGTRLTGLSNQGRPDLEILDAIFLQSCEFAKAEGIAVFTVSAVPNGVARAAHVNDLLVACATSADHAFIQDSDPEGLQAAFQAIGRMVQGIRRTRTIQL